MSIFKIIWAIFCMIFKVIWATLVFLGSSFCLIFICFNNIIQFCQLGDIALKMPFSLVVFFCVLIFSFSIGKLLAERIIEISFKEN